MWRRRPVYETRAAIVVFMIVATLLIAAATAAADVIVTSSSAAGPRKADGVEVESKLTGRRLLAKPLTINCTPRSIDEFPSDFMSEEQRRNGGVIFHIALTLYLFAATAIACDDFFVPSMKKITKACRIPPDVAGATFMAAGSSAPEFFAAVVGIFFAKSDIGVSTIVGSALFNLLGVIAVCGLFAGAVISLTWWTVTRVCLLYAVCVAVLTVIIYDGQVHWYEGLMLILLYVLYVVVVYFNKRIADRLLKNKDGRGRDNEKHSSDEERQPLIREHVSLSEDMRSTSVSRDVRSTSVSEDTRSPSVRLSTENTAKYGTSDKPSHEAETKGDVSCSISDCEEEESLLTPPKGCCRRVLWLIMLPASFLMVVTIPDFRRGGCWEKLYLLTFIVSVAWIGGLCYVMVWMVTIIGDTFGIPDTVMGLTLLAIGSSVPDVLGSFLVARQNYGDMAVSNTVGSNIFDILMCLGVPWFIQTAFIQPDSVIAVTSKGLTYTSMTLFGAIVILMTGFVLNRWRLTKAFGFGCLLAYVVIVVVACLYELNIFGDFTLPLCPS